MRLRASAESRDLSQALAVGHSLRQLQSCGLSHAVARRQLRPNTEVVVPSNPQVPQLGRRSARSIENVQFRGLCAAALAGACHKHRASGWGRGVRGLLRLERTCKSAAAHASNRGWGATQTCSPSLWEGGGHLHACASLISATMRGVGGVSTNFRNNLQTYHG